MKPAKKTAAEVVSPVDDALTGLASAQLFLVVAIAAAILSLLWRSVSAAEPASSQPSFGEMDKMSGVKGWNIGFPSFGDTLTQDYGGWRSSLALAGIGLIQYNSERFQANVLNTPREGPRLNPFYESAQIYWGQKPSFSNTNVLVLTYDLSRFGVPDGQLQFSGINANATYQGFNPDTQTLNFLAYYQTWFDRRLEIKFGLLANQNEFAGQTVGGGFVTTGGPANSIPTLLGMSVSPVSTWSFRVTGHFGDKFYNETAVMRSLVVNGPTGNPLFDTDALNPTRLDWNVNTSSYSPTAEVGAPGTGELFVNEFGYKEDATPGSRYTWLRLGAMYNNSTFHDFTKSVEDGGLVQGAIGPMVDGNAGFYLLADQQIWQPAPDSATTAYRGLYAGATVMYARPRTTPITQYYEGRLYAKAPFPSRPKDLVSLVAYYQVNSPFLVDNLNTLNATGTFGKSETWSATVAYLARLNAGVYLTLGLNYTANPSQALYFGPSQANPSQRFEGNALNFQATLFTAF
ncbi:MAG TPA: carbohydrate porin [Chthoniobacterales bacterium]|nr:carbohydrate porin [Chthoniobacterales bacterium]